jgi:hypothetical protein
VFDKLISPYEEGCHGNPIQEAGETEDLFFEVTGLSTLDLATYLRHTEGKSLSEYRCFIYAKPPYLESKATGKVIPFQVIKDWYNQE